MTGTLGMPSPCAGSIILAYQPLSKVLLSINVVLIPAAFVVVAVVAIIVSVRDLFP